MAKECLSVTAIGDSSVVNGMQWHSYNGAHNSPSTERMWSGRSVIGGGDSVNPSTFVMESIPKDVFHSVIFCRLSQMEIASLARVSRKMRRIVNLYFTDFTTRLHIPDRSISASKLAVWPYLKYLRVINIHQLYIDAITVTLNCNAAIEIDLTLCSTAVPNTMYITNGGQTFCFRPHATVQQNCFSHRRIEGE